MLKKSQIFEYSDTCNSVSEWARKPPAPTNSPVAQRWRMWEDQGRLCSVLQSPLSSPPAYQCLDACYLSWWRPNLGSEEMTQTMHFKFDFLKSFK